jgi:hypothetical protein
MTWAGSGTILGAAFQLVPVALQVSAPFRRLANGCCRVYLAGT